MAKTSMKIKQQRPAKFSTRAYMEFAESASVSWLTKARSPE